MNTIVSLLIAHRQEARFLSSPAALLGVAAIALLAHTSHAADATWNVNAPGNWSDNANWTPASAPGTTSGTTSPDTATFGNIISAARIVTVDSNRNIFGINFAGNSSAYTLSGGSLLLTNGGTIQTSGGGSGHTDIISAPITLLGNGGAQTFTAGSSTATRLLNISGAITGSSNAGNTTTLTLNGSNTGNNAISGNIGNGTAGGQVAITKSGAGNWTLSGSNTFTGPVTVTSGTLFTSGNNALNASNVVSLNAGATMTFAPSGGTTTIIFAGLNDGIGGGGVLVNSGGGGRMFTLRGAGDYSFSGQINNGGGNPTTMIMQGTGTQTLSGSNSFSGGLQVHAGMVKLDFSAPGAPAANIVSNGVAPAPLTLQGGTLNLTGKASTTNSQALGRLIVNAGGGRILLDADAASNPLSLTFGNMTRSQGGTVDIALPVGAQTGSNGVLTTASNVNGIIGGYATVNGSDWAVSGATATAGVAYSTTGSTAPAIFTGVQTDGAAISFNSGMPAGTPVTGSQLYYVVNTTGTTFQISATPGGPPLLGTTSGTSGNTTVNNIGNITALSSYAPFVGTGGDGTANYLLTNSGTVTATQSFNSLKLATTGSGHSLSLTGNTLTLNSGGLLFTGSNNYAIQGGTIRSNSSGTSDFMIHQHATGNLTISSTIANGTGASTLTKSGPGTLILTANNTFTGAVHLNGGILNFNTLGALGAGTAVNFSGGTLQYASGNTADISARTVTINAAGATIDTNGNNVTFANAIGNAGVGGLTKAGSGTLTLGGANTYSGATVVNAGTLLVNNASGSGLGTGNATVNGGRLGGTGGFTGSVTVNSGGTLAPGASIGSLGSGALTFNDGSTFGYEVDFGADTEEGADLQIVSGGLGLNGIVTLTLSNLAVGTFAYNTTFTLINYSGAWNGGLFTYDSGILANGSIFSFNDQSWQIDYNALAGGSNFSSEYLPASSFVNITAVPEPSALAPLGVCIVMAFLGFRRTRKAD